MVKWKDILTGLWRGPDPVLTWARGSVCVFPQDQRDPVWVPEHLTRKAQYEKNDTANEEGEPWPWTGCQSRIVGWAAENKLFTFSPHGVGPGLSVRGVFQQDLRINPFSTWLLCGINGSCMKAEALNMIMGGIHGTGNFSCSLISPLCSTEDCYKLQSPFWSCHYGVKLAKEIVYKPTPVCVYPPFLFIVSNQDLSLCTANSCFYTQCWNASEFAHALVARVPRWIPVPVVAPSAMTHFRHKRDFGITAAVVTAISLAAVGATTAAVAMSHTVQTAQTLNSLSAKVAQALDVQRDVSAQLKGGLMVANQRIDLVQEQIDVLWQIAQLGCEQKYPGLCVTSIQYENFTRAANLSKQLSSYLLGNWSGEFDGLMEQLRMAIVTVNSTRMDAELAEGLVSWFSTAMNHLKEWAGIGALAGLMVLIFLVCLWCIHRVRSLQRRDTAMIVQALTAIEDGQSPCVWLATLKK